MSYTEFLKRRFNVMVKSKKPVFEQYWTKCVFCRREFLTTKNTCNEGICLRCREV